MTEPKVTISMSTQRERFESAYKTKSPTVENAAFRLTAAGGYLLPLVDAAWQGFQLGEASGLERAAAECERLSTAIDNAGKTYNRDTTSTHCALAIRALMAQGET